MKKDQRLRAVRGCHHEEANGAFLILNGTLFTRESQRKINRCASAAGWQAAWPRTNIARDTLRLKQLELGRTESNHQYLPLCRQGRRVSVAKVATGK